MKAIPGTRRLFFKTIGTLGVGLTAWSGSVPGLQRWVRVSEAQAAGGGALDAAQAKEMLAMTRQLFPHAHVGDEYYQVAVDAIAKEMAGSPDLAKQIREGLAQLSQAAGGNFAAASGSQQIAAMKQLESTPFFGAMAGKTRFYFYNNKAIWQKFGYEGSSWEKGGYLHRGFNDVTWTDG